MPSTLVQPVNSIASQQEFLDLPRKLYAQDDQWIPPADGREFELAGFGTHPFFDSAQAQSFLATQGGKTCGRITAVINSEYNQWHDSCQGFFGFYEAIDDNAVARPLLNAARQWLGERNCMSMMGPVNPSITYQCGLLIQGHDESPSFLMPYNPEFYRRHFEQYGLAKVQDLFSFVGDRNMLDSVNPKIVATAKRSIEKSGIHLRHFRMSEFPNEIKTFYEIYHRSLTNMWGFTPLNRGEVDLAGTAYAPVTVPEFTVMAEVDGKPIGTVLGILDFNPLLKKADGKLNWTELPNILATRQKPDRLRIPCTLVLPQYARWGVGPAMLQFLFEIGLDWGLEQVEFSWVAESNWLSKGSLQRGGAKIEKVFRVYEMPI